MATGLVSGTVNLTVGGKPLQLEFSVPAGRVSARSMLPLFRSLTDAFVNMGEEHARTRGLTVSCKKGCGACCRQLVPITEIEAIELRQMVQEMPEPRRAEILRRFQQAREKLQSAGLLEKLEHPEQITAPEIIPFGLQYFSQGIPCPFLEEESCSIHLQRPLACREYQVVSPAEFCARPQDEKVQGIEMLAEVSRVVRLIHADKATPPNRWVPLILALEWADAHPNETPDRLGTEWTDELFINLRKHAVKPAGEPS